METIERYVRPFYLQFLHGNCLCKLQTPDDPFVVAVRSAMSQVATDELSTPLRSDWREKLSAGWLIGLRREATFESTLGELLLASATCFAGQGYCVSLARIGTSRCADYLAAYLDKHLPVGEREYDQKWAVAALARIDGDRGTHVADEYLAQASDWAITSGSRHVGYMDAEGEVERFRQLMTACLSKFG